MSSAHRDRYLGGNMQKDERFVAKEVESPMGSYDVAVVGAGPVGSVAAAAYARKGARVLLLEANPKAASRFAGEWIHPPGYAVLEELDLAPLSYAAQHPACEGFSVFPDDGTEAVKLPYAGGALGVSCEHELLVEELRARVSTRPLVDYFPYARVTSIDDRQTITFRHKRSGESQVRAGHIVGADGRASLVRDHLNLPDGSQMISSMAGLELTDVALPHEGYGHVLLGGPGFMLLYRTSARHIRVCLDLPPAYAGIRRDPRKLWDHYAPCLPTTELREAFRRALTEGKTVWAANRFRPRSCWGRGKVAMVGDAVGHFHPLTGSGMTVGFMDVKRLVESSSIARYGATRESETYVSELLANALYQVIVRRDPTAAALRSSIFRTWRTSPKERERTMRILAGDQARASQFGLAFTKVAVDALSQVTVDGFRSPGRAFRLPGQLAAFVPWSQWALSSAVPKPIRAVSRKESTAIDPLSGIKRRMRLVSRQDAANALRADAQESRLRDLPTTRSHGLKESVALFQQLATEDLRMRVHHWPERVACGAERGPAPLLQAEALRLFGRKEATRSVCEQFESLLGPAHELGAPLFKRLKKHRMQPLSVVQLADQLLAYLHRVACQGSKPAPETYAALELLISLQEASGAFAGKSASQPDKTRRERQSLVAKLLCTHRAVRCICFASEAFPGILGRELSESKALAHRWISKLQASDGGFGATRVEAGTAFDRIYLSALAADALLRLGATTTSKEVTAARRFIEDAAFGVTCVDATTDGEASSPVDPQRTASSATLGFGDPTSLPNEEILYQHAFVLLTLMRAQSPQWSHIEEALAGMLERFHSLRRQISADETTRGLSASRRFAEATALMLSLVDCYLERSRDRERLLEHTARRAPRARHAPSPNGSVSPNQVASSSAEAARGTYSQVGQTGGGVFRSDVVQAARVAAGKAASS